MKASKWMVSGLFLVALVATGCGGSKVGRVSGKVTVNGREVTGGTLQFSPMGEGKEVGKPATAEIKGGSYTLSTFRNGDGALVGKHRVTYTAPLMPYTREPRPGEPRPRSGFEGLVVKQAEVEVKPGSNTLDIELVSPYFRR